MMVNIITYSRLVECSNMAGRKLYDPKWAAGNDMFQIAARNDVIQNGRQEMTCSKMVIRNDVIQNGVTNHNHNTCELG